MSIVLCVLGLGLLGAGEAVAGGSTIDAAQPITPGVQEVGNTSHGVLRYGGCPQPDYADYWTIKLEAGETLSVTFSSATNSLDALDVLPPGTNDANAANVQTLDTYFSSGGTGQQHTTFTAHTTGTYPLDFNSGCYHRYTPGPYTFVVTVSGRSRGPARCSAPPVSSDDGVLLLTPTHQVLPAGQSTTLSVSSLSTTITPGAKVSYQVACGPNSGAVDGTASIERHAGVRGNVAEIAYRDTRPGTDIVVASAAGPSGRSTAVTTVTWDTPVPSCDPALPGVFAALKCGGAQKFLNSIWEADRCVVGAGAFFVPEAKFAKIFEAADTVAAGEQAARDAGASSSIGQLAADLRQLRTSGVSFTAVKKTYSDVQSARGFIEGTWTLLDDMKDSAGVQQIALDLAQADRPYTLRPASRQRNQLDRAHGHLVTPGIAPAPPGDLRDITRRASARWSLPRRHHLVSKAQDKTAPIRVERVELQPGSSHHLAFGRVWDNQLHERLCCRARSRAVVT